MRTIEKKGIKKETTKAAKRIKNGELKILYVSSEVVPFAKTGGLADVAGALPKGLKDLGNDVRVILPKYKGVSEDKYKMKLVLKNMEVTIGDQKEIVDVFETILPGSKVKVYLIANEKYFGSRQDLYQVKGVDFEDNLERFTLFSKAVPIFLKEVGWQPDIIHCNDWQSALIIAYLKVTYKNDPFFNKIGTVYSVHNMGYQGTFPKEKIFTAGLSWSEFTPETLEFYGQLCLAKAGFVYSDVINTVSETYSKEIQTPEYGHGLDGLLRSRSHDVYGIVNGLDYELWDPSVDKMIVAKYSSEDPSEKLTNKLALQKECGIAENKNLPVIGMVTRLSDQKGLDILSEVFDKLMHLGCQFVILGTGDLKYHEFLQKEKKKYPDKIGLNLGFDAALAQRIYAGSDMFIMPSKYEPCGLGQLISFKYGTVPVVRATGGLADTVKEFHPDTGKGDGFVFKDYTSAELYLCVKRAIDAFKNHKSAWKELQKKIMNYDYSWEASAKKYVDLYNKALKKVRQTTITESQRIGKKAISAPEYRMGRF